jgi:hypothetical protein
LDRAGIDAALEGKAVHSLAVRPLGLRHSTDVVALTRGFVVVDVDCAEPDCCCEDLPVMGPVPARADEILSRILRVARLADQIEDGLDGEMLDDLAHWPTEEPPGWFDDDEADEDALGPAVGDWHDEGRPAGEHPDPVAGRSAGTGARRLFDPDRDPVRAKSLHRRDFDGLEDLVNPAASWSPRHDDLRRVLRAVSAGTDLLNDLLPDVDALTIRGHGRRLEAGLTDLRMFDSPAPGEERQWVAARLELHDDPPTSFTGLLTDLTPGEREALLFAVEGSTWLFEGQRSDPERWCVTAAELLDESVGDVPVSVQARVDAPLELLAAAAVTLAARTTAGQVPGRDVTGLDLWFSSGGAFAEFAARGPIIGANEHGDLHAAGLVVVLGDGHLRRRFMDALELGVDHRPTLRLVDELPSGPHLASLAVARGLRPMVLNQTEPAPPLVDAVSLRHLRRGDDPERAAERIVERWMDLVPVGRDSWWEEQPRLHLPALIQALFLAEHGELLARQIADSLEGERLEHLKSACKRAGRPDLSTRLESLGSFGIIGGSTSASIRITIAAAVPPDPPSGLADLRVDRLGRRAHLLTGSAVARSFAAVDLHDHGVAVLWDDVPASEAAASRLARHPGGLTVLGYPNLTSVQLPFDVLRSATVVGLPGSGDLSPIGGRSVEVESGEAALVTDGTLTLCTPVDHLLGPQIGVAYRDAFTRITTRVVRDRLVRSSSAS